jgi:hypothetical protein
MEDYTMSIIDKLSLSSSMLGTFGLITMITISFGVFSMSGMNTLGGLTSTLYNHPLRVSNAALTAQSDIIRMQRDMESLANTNEVHNFNKTILKMNQEEERVYDQLAILKKYILGERGYQLVVAASQSFSEWKPLRDKIISNLQEGKRQEALEINRTEGDDYARMLERKMEELTGYARNKADGFMQNANKVQKHIAQNTRYMLAFLVIALIFFSWIVMKHIVGRISDLKIALKRNEDLNQLVEVNEAGNNEITDLAKNFNSLIGAINRQLWLRDGINELNQRLMDISSMEMFSDTLSYMSKKINAGIAAVFKSEQSTGDSVLISSYSLDSNNNEISRIPAGHGLVGQVAKDMKEINLTGNITNPPSSFSYTGEMIAHSVLIIPLIYKNELVGVAEFAKMEPFTEIEAEFIRFSGSFLAGSLNSINNRTQIDELYKATIASNDMLKQKKVENEEINRKLSKRNQELAEKTTELESQTLTLTELARQLEKQKLELEIKQEQVQQSDRLKSEFLSNMSHELRTPLNSILALSQLMLERRAKHLNPKEKEYITVIEKNGRLLLSLISKILDLSKIESGKMEVAITRFTAEDVVSEVLETITPLANKKGLALQSELLFRGEINSDRYKIIQILLNLCSNAVKFTDKGSISINLERENDNAVFTVSDTGIGIPQDQQDYIFGEFQQVDGSASKKHEGTGLGLSISKKFAQMLGGDISVESSDNNGSSFKFYVKINYCTESKDDICLVPDKPEKKNNSKKILVVDDMQSHRELIRKYLEDNGYSVIECEEDKSAVNIASQNKFYAIILDILMPGMDGWEVLQNLKQNTETEKIPVILVSVAKDKTTASALGASGYLSKPPNKEKLLSILAGLEKKQSLKVVITGPENSRQLPLLCNSMEKSGFNVSESDYPNPEATDIIIFDCGDEEKSQKILHKIYDDPKLSTLPLIQLADKNISGRTEVRAEGNDEIVFLDEDYDITILDLVQKVEEIIKSKQAKTDSLAEEQREINVEINTNEPFGENSTILAVEDNAENIMVLKEVLNIYTGKLVVAETGEEAISLALSIKPDLILMDIHLPGITGLEATKIIKANPDTASIPVLAVTARAMHGEKENFIKAGCDDYIAKPYAPDELIKTVRTWLTSRETD